MFIRELAELDEWLAGQIEPEDRRTLAVLGREMTARQLQVLARQALEPHLDLAPA